MTDDDASEAWTYSRDFSRRMLRYRVGPDAYHALVGEYLTTWLEFEQAMNSLLSRWFSPGDDAEGLVELLNAVPLARRLRELRRISDSAAIAHSKALNDALRKAYDMRNRMAHQPITVDPSDPLAVLSAKGQPLHQEELHADLMTLVSAAETIIVRLADALDRRGPGPRT